VFYNVSRATFLIRPDRRQSESDILLKRLPLCRHCSETDERITRVDAGKDRNLCNYGVRLAEGTYEGLV